MARLAPCRSSSGPLELQALTRRLNCYASYDTAAEPGYKGMGSMMAQSVSDFVFWTCMTVGAQDSIWAAGRLNATDICERCHFLKGWLEGRPDPTNASLLTGPTTCQAVSNPILDNPGADPEQPLSTELNAAFSHFREERTILPC